MPETMAQTQSNLPQKKGVGNARNMDLGKYRKICEWGQGKQQLQYIQPKCSLKNKKQMFCVEVKIKRFSFRC